MIKTVFQATDGAQFDTEAEARERELELDRKSEERYAQYLMSHPEHPLPGKRANWVVRGEDPNCDLGGYHHQPLLGVVHGTYRAAVMWAVQHPGFYAWGNGGTVEEQEVQEVHYLD